MGSRVEDPEAPSRAWGKGKSRKSRKSRESGVGGGVAFGVIWCASKKNLKLLSTCLNTVDTVETVDSRYDLFEDHWNKRRSFSSPLPLMSRRCW